MMVDNYPDTFAFVQIHPWDGYATAWGQSRANFYGAGGTPDAWFDGITEASGTYENVTADYNRYRSIYNTRRAVATDVTIELSGAEAGASTYTVTAKVCLEPGGTQKSMRLYMVQVLDDWPTSPTYQRNGFKQAATVATINPTPGTCATVDRTFTFDGTSMANQDDIKIIAWVQQPLSSAPAQVYQAGIMTWPFPAGDCNENGIADACDLDCGPGGGECDVPGCGLSSDCNGNTIPDECEADCNTNGIPDECDITGGTSDDCDHNWVPDACDLKTGAVADCNGNSIPDSCDTTSGTSEDCNNNSVPDNCELDAGSSQDCNSNSIPDECDTALGTSEDCNGNSVPDDCELLAGSSQDCNANNTPDECDISAAYSLDCNDTGVPDECELAAGTAPDCNANGTPDSCDISEDDSEDCNDTGIPDECELAFGTSEDCDSNNTPDECDLDCNENSTPDVCEVPPPGGICTENCVPDCNANGIPDECDIASRASVDCNSNGIPDTCDLVAGVVEDCNENDIPDECEGARCRSIWNGFVKNSPPALFQAGQPMESIDYIPYAEVGNGDGSVWNNNGTGTATTGSGYGCDAGDANDLTLQVDLLAGSEPELGFVESEYFQDIEGGLLASSEQVYSLSFNTQLIRSSSPYYDYNPRTDWRFIIYDASRGEAVFHMELVSTISARTDTGLVPGFVVVKNPAGSPTKYSDTGIEIEPWLWYCRSFEIILDNTQNRVKLFFENELKATIQLSPAIRRMDYFRIQPVLNGNGATEGNDSSLRIDSVDLCLTGGAAVSPSVYDCNDNGVLDACDIADGISTDCDENGVADGCRIYGDADLDGSVGLSDYALFEGCLAAPGQTQTPACEAYGFDFDCDTDVDMADFARFQDAFE